MKIKTIPTEIDVLVHYSQTYPRLFITATDKKTLSSTMPKYKPTKK
jgi:hypothetical protein